VREDGRESPSKVSFCVLGRAVLRRSETSTRAQESLIPKRNKMHCGIRPLRTTWALTRFTIGFLCLAFAVFEAQGQTPAPAWRGTVQDESQHAIAAAQVKLEAGEANASATTASDGSFVFETPLPKTYHLSVEAGGRIYRSDALLKIPAQDLKVALILNSDGTLALSVPSKSRSATSVHGSSRTPLSTTIPPSCPGWSRSTRQAAIRKRCP
jgi:hypothetical protein